MFLRNCLIRCNTRVSIWRRFESSFSAIFSPTCGFKKLSKTQESQAALIRFQTKLVAFSLIQIRSIIPNSIYFDAWLALGLTHKKQLGNNNVKQAMKTPLTNLLRKRRRRSITRKRWSTFSFTANQRVVSCHLIKTTCLVTSASMLLPLYHCALCFVEMLNRLALCLSISKLVWSRVISSLNLNRYFLTLTTRKSMKYFLSPWLIFAFIISLMMIVAELKLVFKKMNCVISWKLFEHGWAHAYL